MVRQLGHLGRGPWHSGTKAQAVPPKITLADLLQAAASVPSGVFWAVLIWVVEKSGPGL